MSTIQFNILSSRLTALSKYIKNKLYKITTLPVIFSTTVKLDISN
jgi:hypothetical protein